jgi:hypothetical protein
MQMFKFNAIEGEAERPIESRLSPIGFPARSTPQAQGFRRALQALSAAYARVGDALSDRMQHPTPDQSERSALGATFGWISDRRLLVHTYLESEPAVMAYACADFGQPEQIRALAETASELAGEEETLFSALGLLSYIDHELGWAAVGGAPAGNA